MKLPQSILSAVALYYLNRSRQYIVGSHRSPDMPPLTVMRSGYRWFKEIDLQRIKHRCRTKWTMTNSSGTFYFTNVRTKETYQVDEETFPAAKRVK